MGIPARVIRELNGLEYPVSFRGNPPSCRPCQHSNCRIENADWVMQPYSRIVFATARYPLGGF